jgi:hypothetical protein
MKLYLQSPIRLQGVVLSSAQGQLYLCFTFYLNPILVDVLYSFSSGFQDFFSAVTVSRYLLWCCLSSFCVCLCVVYMIMVLQIWVWVRGWQLLIVKKNHVTKCHTFLELAGCCEHVDEPEGFHKRRGNFLTGWVTVSFSRRTLLHGVCDDAKSH